MKKKIEIIGPLVSIVSVVLALVNQYYNVFWSLEYAPEALLAICCTGLMYYGGRLLTKKPNRLLSLTQQRRIRYTGIAVLILAPVLGLLFWASALRLSPEKQKELDDSLGLARGYEAMGDKYKDDAIENYEVASRIAPWKGSIKLRIRELESKKKQ